MNFKTKIALTCGLSASLVLVGSLTPTVAYAVQNTKTAKNEEKSSSYQYTDADVVDTKTNLLINIDRYPFTTANDKAKDFNIEEEIAKVFSASKNNEDKVNGLITLAGKRNITLVNYPLVLNEVKNREISLASQIANNEEFNQLKDLYNSLHKEYAVYQILSEQVTTLNDAILANHDEQSNPAVAKLRAQNLLKYEIDAAKKSHEQIEQAATFKFNNNAAESLNSYYYEGNSESFITIDQMKEQGILDFGTDITSYLPTLAVNKNEMKDAFNLIQNTSYTLNDTGFTLYARINDYDYSKANGNFDIAIDYGMIESKYDALPNREDFIIWYSDAKDQMQQWNEEFEQQDPLTYHMLVSNEKVGEWTREWFEAPEHQLSFIQDNDHGYDTVRKIFEEKGGYSHQFTMEEMAQFMTLPNGVKIDHTSLPDVNLKMTINTMDPTTNRIDYKLTLTFDYVPDVTIESDNYYEIVAVSKKTVEDLLNTYKNIVDTITVFNDWAYERKLFYGAETNVSEAFLNYSMIAFVVISVVLIVVLNIHFGSLLFDPKYFAYWWGIVISLIALDAAGVVGTSISVNISLFNFENEFSYRGKSYSRADYWYCIEDILAKMQDDHKDDIDNYVTNMYSSVKANADKIEKIRKNPNPSMADIDEMVGVFGNYEKPTDNDPKNWTLGQKAYVINDWMNSFMWNDQEKYNWMSHVRYGIDYPTHDITKEVPCAIVANKPALTSQTIFSVVPPLLATEITLMTAAYIGLGVCLVNAEHCLGPADIVEYYIWGLAVPVLTTAVCTSVIVNLVSLFIPMDACSTLSYIISSLSSSAILSPIVATTILTGEQMLFQFLLFATADYKRITLTTGAMLLCLEMVYFQVVAYIVMFSNFR